MGRDSTGGVSAPQQIDSLGGRQARPTKELCEVCAAVSERRHGGRGGSHPIEVGRRRVCRREGVAVERGVQRSGAHLRRRPRELRRGGREVTRRTWLMTAKLRMCRCTPASCASWRCASEMARRAAAAPEVPAGGSGVSRARARAGQTAHLSPRVSRYLRNERVGKQRTRRRLEKGQRRTEHEDARPGGVERKLHSL